MLAMLVSLLECARTGGAVFHFLSAGDSSDLYFVQTETYYVWLGAISLSGGTATHVAEQLALQSRLVVNESDA